MPAEEVPSGARAASSGSRARSGVMKLLKGMLVKDSSNGSGNGRSAEAENGTPEGAWQGDNPGSLPGSPRTPWDALWPGHAKRRVGRAGSTNRLAPDVAPSDGHSVTHSLSSDLYSSPQLQPSCSANLEAAPGDIRVHPLRSGPTAATQSGPAPYLTPSAQSGPAPFLPSPPTAPSSQLPSSSPCSPPSRERPPHAAAEHLAEERPSPDGPSTAPSPAHAVPPAQPATTGRLLIMSQGTPQAMRRPHWSLAHYSITKRVYKGASSSVYQAACLHSGLPVALKVYFLTKTPRNAVHMIVREIQIHSDSVHKNIAMLYGAFEEESKLVLVEEWAARGDLYGIHRAMNKRMSETQVVELVLAPFLDALVYLHARGVCHRDIKERAVTRAGTLDYMAPEVERCPIKYQPNDNKERDDLAYSTAVDIWATGVLAYELLVGFPPFVADNASGHAQQPHGAGGAFLAGLTSKTLSFPSSTSEAARDFIARALAERPEERPTALQMMEHPWLRAAVQRRALFARRSTSLNGSPIGSGGPPPGVVHRTPSRTPSRLGAGEFRNVSPSAQAVAMEQGMVA